MSERQYERYHSLPSTQLGVCANQLWLEDPKMVGIHLAHYKFVAKMLAGKNMVAEIGCGDGWYSQVVAQTVGTLCLYDFDQSLINDAVRHDIFINHHDITEEELHTTFEAIYSLDVMEHIHPTKERVYLENICKSLIPDGVFIVGMPSLESQRYASDASKIGHVNCLSGEDFKASLEKYFRNVFLFTMHDEQLGVSFLPMSQYLMAVCCGIR